MRCRRGFTLSELLVATALVATVVFVVVEVVRQFQSAAYIADAAISADGSTVAARFVGQQEPGWVEIWDVATGGGRFGPWSRFRASRLAGTSRGGRRGGRRSADGRQNHWRERRGFRRSLDQSLQPEPPCRRLLNVVATALAGCQCHPFALLGKPAVAPV
jgi:prepilin-type N-terminal cleavage/methylation domain-containing protein